MTTFDPAAYGPAFEKLLRPPRLPALAVDPPFRNLRPLLEALEYDSAFAPSAVRDPHMAAACRAGVQALGLELFAAQPIDGLTVVKTPEGIDGVALVSKLEKQYGIRIAGGQDPLKGKIFRIAHMGYIDQFDVLSALSALEMVLLEMGYSLEPGSSVAAAQQVLVQQVRTPQTV